MKRTLSYTSAIVVGLGILRYCLALWLQVADAHWECVWGPSLIFVLAFLEISWARWSFERLEPVITGLIEGRRQGSVERWYKQSVTRMFRLKPSILTALAFFPIIVFAETRLDWGSWLQGDVLRWFDIITFGLMFTAAASSQWPFAAISAFIIRMPDKKLNINFYVHPRDSIMAVGSFMTGIALGGMLLTCLVGLMVYLSPAIRTPEIDVLIIAVLIWAFVWFFLTQWNLHECMAKEKRAKLRTVSNSLMSSVTLCLQEPTQQNIERHEAIRDFYDRIAGLPEWPFNLQNVATLATSVILPIGLALFTNG